MLRILLRCACTQCGHKIDFADDQVGKIVQCPKCQKETELFQPNTELSQVEQVRTKPLVVVPRLAVTTDFVAREIGLRAQNCSPLKRTIPEPKALPVPKGLPSILKVTCSLIAIALIGTAILFLDDLKVWLQYLRTLVRW